MARRPPYVPAFVDAVGGHLRAIDVKHHSLIREKIREQFLFEPERETANRKPLRRPAAFGATWEIRFGPKNRFRVLYDVDREVRVVIILAIGEQLRESLFIGGEEVELRRLHRSRRSRASSALS